MVVGSYGTANGTGTAPTGMISWKPMDSPVPTRTIRAVPKASGLLRGVEADARDGPGHGALEQVRPEGEGQLDALGQRPRGTLTATPIGVTQARSPSRIAAYR